MENLFSGIIAFISEPLKNFFLKHTVSELGSNSLTPLPYLFDLACVLAGLISIPFYHLLRKKMERNKLSGKKTARLLKYGTLIGCIGGLGYLFVGIFSLERAGPNNIYHNAFAGFAFSGYVISIVLYSIHIIYFQIKITRIYGMFGFFGPLLFLGLYFITFFPLLEWLLLVSILIFNLPLSFWTFLK